MEAKQLAESFKIRASAAGKLLTDPKNKSDKLSQTTKSYLNDWCKEQIFGMRKQLDTKEINKGLIYENEAIDLAIDWCNLDFAVKNDKNFEDDFFTGEPDLILSDEIIDIKNSWDWTTIPLFESKCPNPDYIAQCHVYMHLTGKKKASVLYMLLTTPETYKNMEIKYDHIDIKFRHKRFNLDYDNAMIEKLQERVLLSREYIYEIMSSFC